ncbi:ATP-dependent DNA/RNA helicase DHX36-like [Homarus americanus]|uniref:ATP-dependent DNA/RNA helicase DHX36-like n=1 Tax=Homarus americanus TaxID=6706 RepID=UPI001C452356|nr:ATP-dependent DNA/RNA helicase DHX36-like [Homarus americanus]
MYGQRGNAYQNSGDRGGGGWRRGRGRGGWRGGKGRGEGGGGGEEGRGRGRGSRRGGRPPGLKGKEIGLWYARRGSERREREEQNLPSISMNDNQLRDVGRILDSFDGGNNLARSAPKMEGAGSAIQYTDDLSQEWDQRISSIIKLEFDNGVKIEAGCSNNDIDEIDHFSNPYAWMQDNKQKRKANVPIPGEDNEKRSRGDTFTQRLENISESDFKQAYMANVFGNLKRDAGGLHALKGKQIGLPRIEVMDNRLYEDMLEQQNSKAYQEMLKVRKRLPSYKMKDEIIDTIQENQVVVLSGETGCGKTTQVAQFILEDAIADGHGSTCHIVCTQPRRISAISVAQRVADERGEKLGKSIGYQIRLEA